MAETIFLKFAKMVLEAAPLSLGTSSLIHYHSSLTGSNFLLQVSQELLELFGLGKESVCDVP